MSTKTTAGLVLVFAGLCGAFWFAAHRETVVQERAVESRRVFDFGPEEITTLMIERLGESPVAALRASEQTWRIAEPHPNIAANSAVWERVALNVSSLSNERTVSEYPETLEEFGLAEPILRVTVGSRDTLSQIAVGALEPTQIHRYARVGNGPVMLITTHAAVELDRTLAELRDRHIVRVGEDGIRRIEYARYRPQESGEDTPAIAPGSPRIMTGEESVVVAFERDAGGEWNMVEPIVAKADQKAVAALATELQFAQGRRYIDVVESVADYGLTRPGARITVYSDPDSQGQTIYLGWAAGGDDGGLFVRRAGGQSVFVIDGHILTLLPREPMSFRDRFIFAREASALHAIQYRDGNGGFRLDLDETLGWRLVEPVSVKTDQRAVSSYIASIKQIEGQDFPEGDSTAEFGLDSPRIAIDFQFNEGPPVSIRVGRGVPESEGDTPGEYAFYYASRTDGAVTTLAHFAVEQLRRNAFDLRVKKLFVSRAGAVERLSVVLKGKRHVIRKVENRWVLSEPAEMKLESQSDAQGLLESVSGASMIGLPSAEDDLEEAQVFAAPALEISVTLAEAESGSETVLGPLIVGTMAGEQSRNRYAKMEGSPEIFLVNQGLIDDIREALRGVIPK